MTFPITYPRDVPRLTDGVVTLRAHTVEDVPALQETADDPEMVRWTTVPVPSTRESAREFATGLIPEGWRSDREWAFAVEAPDDEGRPRFVGTVSLRNERERRAEIAYGSHPWARGRGYVLRALRLLVDWGFEHKDLESLIWLAHKGNWASRKVAWRLGFSVDGTLRRWLPQRGELHDAWVGVLTRDDRRAPKHRWYDVPRIVGEQIVLRPPRPEDSDRIVEACSDERSAHWLTDLPTPYTLDAALGYVEYCRDQAASGRGVSWVVADPETDELLGNISLMDLTHGEDAEIGYWAHPAARGRGVMTEACGAVVRHAFVPEEDGGLGLRRLRIEVVPENVASLRVIERNGFVRTGRHRKAHRRRDGGYDDLLTFDMLVSEYRPGGQAQPASRRPQRSTQ